MFRRAGRESRRLALSEGLRLTRSRPPSCSSSLAIRCQAPPNFRAHRNPSPLQDYGSSSHCSLLAHGKLDAVPPPGAPAGLLAPPAHWPFFLRPRDQTRGSPQTFASAVLVARRLRGAIELHHEPACAWDVFPMEGVWRGRQRLHNRTRGIDRCRLGWAFLQACIPCRTPGLN